MGFSTNYDDVNSDLIPEGTYEVVIKKAEERATKTGAVGMNFHLVIRADVDQSQKKRYIFHTLWKRKNPTQADMQVQGYGFNQIMQLAKSAKIPAGASYETVYDLCRDLTGRFLRVKVVHDTWQGVTRAIVDSIDSTKFPHVANEVPDISSDSIGDLSDFEVLSDGDVPF